MKPEFGDCIRVRGARVHNLKNVDIDVPRNCFVVITGPSGSGKSSLAFDTIFAEGQRQFLASLSTYSRQFLHQLERPDVDLVDGLQPTVCIDQRPAIANPRSTVSTVTEIYDYLRLLFARLGEIFCFQCGEPICQQTPEQIAELLAKWPDGSKVMLLAPFVRGQRGEHKEVFQEIRKAGLVRVRVDGELYELDRVPELAPRRMHTIEAVVDRVVIRCGIGSRLAESIPLAVRHGQGVVIASRLVDGNEPANPQSWRDVLFSTRYACPKCDVSMAELEPRSFSFNSPYGACPVCEGLGLRVEFDGDLVLPDRTQSLSGGAALPWRHLKGAALNRFRGDVSQVFGKGLDLWETPLDQWPPELAERLLRGDEKAYAGMLMMLEKEFATCTDDERFAELQSYRGEVRCTGCQGSRLRREAGSVRVAGKAIHEITAHSVEGALALFKSLTFEDEQAIVAAPLLREIIPRLGFLVSVGVGYLTLDRSADTLSGGELQRVRLASCIGSGLVGTCYVLDEPSIGLHPRDNARLLTAIRDLQQQGNSVIVVEHDEDTMLQADWLIDMGPGAGLHGGEVTCQGTPAFTCEHAQSLTGRYLSGREAIAIPSQRRRAAKTRSIVLEGATGNNLRGLDVSIPLGTLICVTGVSGSGKSTLVNETLARAMVRKLGGVTAKPCPYVSLRGASQIDKVVVVDQSPLGRSPRSNPATYTGLFDDIRRVFAETREAKQRGFGAPRFSFNVKGGRCEECQGQGLRRIEMNFLPDLFVPCSACNGARFNKPTLAVKYRGLSIAEVLALRVDEAYEFFANFANIARVLASLRDVGLGYLPLGQSSNHLSGGEAQRVRLATELARVDTGATLYFLDEPTTGLHFDDVRRLLTVLHRLVDRGNTVLVIEHNVDVMKSADWIIDLGPEGGAGGGQLLFAGSPEEMIALAGNATADALRKAMRSAQGRAPQTG